MNYTQLRDAIIAYTENRDTEFADLVPTFVRQTEQRVFNTVQFPSLLKLASGVTVISNKLVACPDDFLSMQSLAVIKPTGEYEYLVNKDANFIRQAYPRPTDLATPKYYAIFGPTVVGGVETNELSLILGPTPDAAYPVEFHYYHYPESITTAASGQSWLGDNFDSVLLYGSLVEAYIYMKGEQDMMAAYEAKFKEALAMAKRLGDGLERQDAYRSGQFKQPVT